MVLGILQAGPGWMIVKILFAQSHKEKKILRASVKKYLLKSTYCLVLRVEGEGRVTSLACARYSVFKNTPGGW